MGVFSEIGGKLRQSGIVAFVDLFAVERDPCLEHLKVALAAFAEPAHESRRVAHLVLAVGSHIVHHQSHRRIVGAHAARVALAVEFQIRIDVAYVCHAVGRQTQRTSVGRDLRMRLVGVHFIIFYQARIKQLIQRILVTHVGDIAQIGRRIFVGRLKL